MTRVKDIYICLSWAHTASVHHSIVFKEPSLYKNRFQFFVKHEFQSLCFKTAYHYPYKGQAGLLTSIQPQPPAIYTQFRASIKGHE